MSGQARRKNKGVKAARVVSVLSAYIACPFLLLMFTSIAHHAAAMQLLAQQHSMRGWQSSDSSRLLQQVGTTIPDQLALHTVSAMPRAFSATQVCPKSSPKIIAKKPCEHMGTGWVAVGLCCAPCAPKHASFMTASIRFGEQERCDASLRHRLTILLCCITGCVMEWRRPARAVMGQLAARALFERTPAARARLGQHAWGHATGQHAARRNAARLMERYARGQHAAGRNAARALEWYAAGQNAARGRPAGGGHAAQHHATQGFREQSAARQLLVAGACGRGPPLNIKHISRSHG